MADVKKTTKPAADKAKKAVKAPEVKTVAQLHEELSTLRTDNRETRRSHVLGELVNPRVLREQRKSIARTLTAIKQAEASAAKEEN